MCSTTSALKAKQLTKLGNGTLAKQRVCKNTVHLQITPFYILKGNWQEHDMGTERKHRLIKQKERRRPITQSIMV